MISSNRASYVLITPARNEEAYIEETIKSVISQTILPKKWVIVSDGSTDRTDDIANKYAIRHDFIQLIRADGDRIRNFGSKAKSIDIGYGQLKKIEYDFIGNLDADISFDQNYFENILTKFHANMKLGIGGGVICEIYNGKTARQSTSVEWSVSGAIQLFRRQCYVDIGGYIPTKRGIDAIAEIMARMHGWEVRSFPEFKVWHHRPTGTAKQSILSAKFKLGMQDYSIGNLPSFEIVRCIYRSLDKPYIVGSIAILLGYFFSFLRRNDIVVPNDFKEYLRKEQIGRLRSLFQTNRSKVNSESVK